MRTGYTFDPTHIQHTMSGHNENRRRLDTVMRVCTEDGIFSRLQRLPLEDLPLERLLGVHDRDYLHLLAEIETSGVMMLDLDTYATNESFAIARRAVGGLLNLTDAVLEGRLDNGFAICRPPGHHALRYAAMGFCLLNTVALAADHARRKHGVKRIAIVDFDVHHGNGTQDAFYNDPDVLFCSTHLYPFYPGTGGESETGYGPGEGTTVNIPLPQGTGDAGLLAAYRQVIAPIVRQFRPELILVSAGYDAHWKDPIGGMRLSVTGLMAVLQEIMGWADALCDGKLVLTLEGGYDTEALGHNVLSSLRLLQNPDAAISDPFGPPPEAETNVARTLDRIAELHK